MSVGGTRVPRLVSRVAKTPPRQRPPILHGGLPACKDRPPAGFKVAERRLLSELGQGLPGRGQPTALSWGLSPASLSLQPDFSKAKTFR